MKTNRYTRLFLLLLAAGFLLAACGGGDAAPGDALVLRWMHSTSIANWAQTTTQNFNSQNVQSSDGRPIWVEAIPIDAGLAADQMLSQATELPMLWTASSTMWTDVVSTEAQQEVFLPTCPSIAQSPLVIAMWQPIAEALGWPSRTLGWLDIGSLAADPTGWAYYSGGQYGDTLRIGHTHPGLSDSGVETLLSLVYAAENSPESISLENVSNPIVQASVGAFESAVSWFSTDTRQLASAILDRGTNFLNAAMMYENQILTQGERSPHLVAIYPFEGTFMATFPTCVRAGMDEITTNAAESFLAHLLDQPAQESAAANGLRPVHAGVPFAVPEGNIYGIDPAQPERIFQAADADTVFAVQELWQQQRKDVNLVMVLDVSGSMRGEKLEQLRLSAIEFVRQMGQDDRLTVIMFADTALKLVENQIIGTNQDMIIQRLNSLAANGGTALYDSIAFAAEHIQQNRRQDEVNAMVVLTDGQDTASRRFTSASENFSNLVSASAASVYTIAYGEDADQNTLQQIALATQGIAYTGDVSNIGDIYAEISAAFGGSLGIGR